MYDVKGTPKTDIEFTKSDHCGNGWSWCNFLPRGLYTNFSSDKESPISILVKQTKSKWVSDQGSILRSEEKVQYWDKSGVESEEIKNTGYFNGLPVFDMPYASEISLIWINM